MILQGYLTEGLQTITYPINGYLNEVPRLLSLVSLKISFTHYPMVSTILAWCFIVAVVVALSVSPIVLQGGVLLGAVTMLVPSDAEVIGIPLYTFWWASLLIFVAALWRPYAGGLWWRLTFTGIGGLTSPAIFLSVPIFVARLWRFRDVGEIAVSSVACVCACLQLVVLKLSLFSGQNSAVADMGGGIHNLHNLGVVVPNFLGMYLVGNLGGRNPVVLELAGALTLIFVAYSVVRDPRKRVMAVLCYLWVGSVALTAARINLTAIDPVFAGPRYFFFPYVFESWLLLQFAIGGQDKAIRLCARALLLLAIGNALPVLSRDHADLHWSERVAACVQADDSGQHGLPYETDGHIERVGQLSISADQCRSAAASSLLH